jgi:transcriptional regulator with XRE-family HTH domain
MDIVNKKIRKLRKNKNITLKELSNKTNLSVSFISQVERGVSSITITSLKKIADALEISMQELFEVEEEESYIRKKDNKTLANLENAFTSHIRLSGKFENRKLEAVILKIAANNTDMTPFSHEGEEFYYIISGTGIFIIDDKEYIVKTGESIHFPSTIPHTVINPYDEEFQALSVVTPTIF